MGYSPNTLQNRYQALVHKNNHENADPNDMGQYSPLITQNVHYGAPYLSVLLVASGRPGDGGEMGAINLQINL